MKLLLRLIAGLTGLILLLILVGFLLPRHYRVERRTVVPAPAEAVFPLFADLRAWRSWSAWHERDPGMKVTYSDPSAGSGAWSQWESATEGNGRMTITAHEPPQRVLYRLEFPDMGMSSTGQLALQPAAGGVEMVWTNEGDLGMNPVSRWFGLFLDGMIGPDFERGLARLKAVAERPGK